LDDLRNFASQLGLRRLALMGGVALATLLGIGYLAWGTSPTMGYLYSDLDPQSAQAITEKLNSQGIPFQLSADGTAVMAPVDKLPELRMSLASEQLGGKIGYEVLDAEQPFGVSASRARMTETRAIEGELAKSIESLQAVSKARVHIVMPERALFATGSRPASAAVSLTTRGPLKAEAVEAIRNLVASSIPDLSPDKVSVVDQRGTLLARAGDGLMGSNAWLEERQASIEERLRQEVETMLEPIVGAGRVRAEVSAVIDRDDTKEEAEIFDPDKQVISHQTSVENSGQNDEATAGPQSVSVASQLPENQGQQAGMPGDSRKSMNKEASEETAYDNSRTRKTVVRPPGTLRRLTVSVMIDGGSENKITDAQIPRLKRLVENAVGFDSDRGDSVVVERMNFVEVETGADGWDGLPFGITASAIFDVIKLLILGVLGLLALRMFRRRMGDGPVLTERRLLAGSPGGSEVDRLATAGDEQAIRQIEAMRAGGNSPDIEQEIARAQVDGRMKVNALERVGDVITTSPAEAAAVIRQWMQT